MSCDSSLKIKYPLVSENKKYNVHRPLEHFMIMRVKHTLNQSIILAKLQPKRIKITVSKLLL